MLLTTTLNSWSQEKTDSGFADSTYYLIPDLILEKLTVSDSTLLERELKRYHGSDHDTGRLAALNLMIEQMRDDTWEKYQYFFNDLVERALKKRSRKI